MIFSSFPVVNAPDEHNDSCNANKYIGCICHVKVIPLNLHLVDINKILVFVPIISSLSAFCLY